jgi:KRAB domain-containing zinc finger protein
MTFSCESKLEAHQVVHTDDKPFTCSCNMSFQMCRLFKSQSTYCAFKLSFICVWKHVPFQTIPWIKYLVTYITRMTFYVNIMDSRVKRFICVKCPMTFSCESKLEAHQVVHTDDKPFTCNKCGRQYKYNFPDVPSDSSIVCS